MRQLILSAVLAFLTLVAAQGAGAGEIETTVIEDTWIQGLSSTNPQGANPQLGICPSANYWIYLKFDLPSSDCPVDGAELRMVRTQGTNPQEISVYEVFDDTWSEDTLVGPNRPEPVSPPAGTGLAAGQASGGYDAWTSAALDAVVQAQANGDGILSLMLREDPFPMIDVRYYRSKEAPVPDAEKPRLIVDLGTHSVVGLVLAEDGGTQLSWESTGDGGVFDVAAGEVVDLVADMGVDGATCLAENVSTTSWVDPSPDPPSGVGRYYIVRVQNVCGSGSWGTTSRGQERTPVAACL